MLQHACKWSMYMRVVHVCKHMLLHTSLHVCTHVYTHGHTHVLQLHVYTMPAQNVWHICWCVCLYTCIHMRIVAKLARKCRRHRSASISITTRLQHSYAAAVHDSSRLMSLGTERQIVSLLNKKTPVAVAVAFLSIKIKYITI